MMLEKEFININYKCHNSKQTAGFVINLPQGTEVSPGYIGQDHARDRIRDGLTRSLTDSRYQGIYRYK